MAEGGKFSHQTWYSRTCQEGKNKKTVVLSGSGGESALVAEEIAPYVRGVIVVADGGGNIKVKEALLRAVRAALGIVPHKIEVFERNEVYDDGN